MNKVLTLAVAVLVLSVGPAFAEPPAAAVAGEAPGVDALGIEQLSDAETITVTGGMSPFDVCTAALDGLASSAVTIGRVLAIHSLHVGGAFSRLFVPRICA